MRTVCGVFAFAKATHGECDDTLMVIPRNRYFAIEMHSRDKAGPVVGYCGNVELTRSLEHTINLCVARHGSHTIALHAGAVALGGVATLIAGPSGSGKSTLVARLVERGALYLSDELALINQRRDGRFVILPFPKSISVKEGASHFFRSKIDGFVGPEGNRVAYLPAERLGRMAACDVAWRSAKIAFVSYVPGVATRLRRISEAEAIAAICSCSICTSGNGKRLAIARSFAREHPAYELVFDDLDVAVDSLLSL